MCVCRCKGVRSIYVQRVMSVYLHTGGCHPTHGYTDTGIRACCAPRYTHVGACACMCIRDGGTVREPMPVPEQVLDSRNQEE